jgi:hypothetical protein
MNKDIINIIRKYTLPLLEVVNKNKKRLFNELLCDTTLLQYCLDEKKYEVIYDPGWNHKYHDCLNNPFRISIWYKIKRRSVNNRKPEWVITYR